jgi:hypothetical protein
LALVEVLGLADPTHLLPAQTERQPLVWLPSAAAEVICQVGLAAVVTTRRDLPGHLGKAVPGVKVRLTETRDIDREAAVAGRRNKAPIAVVLDLERGFEERCKFLAVVAAAQPTATTVIPLTARPVA